jgi:hypothetical protein
MRALSLASICRSITRWKCTFTMHKGFIGTRAMMALLLAAAVLCLSGCTTKPAPMSNLSLVDYTSVNAMPPPSRHTGLWVGPHAGGVFFVEIFEDGNLRTCLSAPPYYQAMDGKYTDQALHLRGRGRPDDLSRRSASPHARVQSGEGWRLPPGHLCVDLPGRQRTGKAGPAGGDQVRCRAAVIIGSHIELNRWKRLERRTLSGSRLMRSPMGQFFLHVSGA